MIDDTRSPVIALLADIHANIEALDACLKHAGQSGATRYAFLGDLVGYGADPQRVVETVMRYQSGGALVVQGNHDAAVVTREGGMSDQAAEARDWTRDALDRLAKDWLGSLPVCVREDTLCFVHASAATPHRWEYVEDAARAWKSIQAAGTTYTFSGHVHHQALYFESTMGKVARFVPVPGSAVPVPDHRRWLTIAGSAGQPRDGNPAAAYALFDEVHKTITFHRVPYDHLTAARKIHAAGLPDLLAWKGPR